MNRRLALAALDPNAAIASVGEVSTTPSPVVASRPIVVGPADYEELTLSVEVVQPKPISRWRFYLFLVLVRLAARVVRFNFSITRSEP